MLLSRNNLIPMFKIWLILFLAFSTYTLAVYKYCDNKKVDIPGKQITAGWKIWQEKNCQSCHQIYGLGGYMGPDLTNITSDTTQNELGIKTFIKYGTDKMPDFKLNDSDVAHLVAFLKWIDKSGKNKVTEEKVTWSGNYNIEN